MKGLSFTDIIMADVAMWKTNQLTWSKFLALYLSNPEFRLVFYYRVYSLVGKKNFFCKCLAKILWLRSVRVFGCYISPKAVIGPGLRIHHATGVVIGDGTRIGADANIYQNTTFGAKGGAYPTLGDRCTVFANACIIGSAQIGDDAQVGACALVTRDFPEGAIAVGVPAKDIQKR